MEIELPKKRKDISSGKKTAVLDRIDSEGHYEIGNIQWLHKHVNIIKWDSKIEDMLFYIDKIINKYEKIYEMEKIIQKRHVKWTGFGNLSGQNFYYAKVLAKERGIEFSVTIEECWNKYAEQNGQCAITKIPIPFREYNQPQYGNKTASLDRIDSSLGYTFDNIQWLHKNVNQMKFNFEEEYFLELCKKIYYHSKSQGVYDQPKYTNYLKQKLLDGI